MRSWIREKTYLGFTIKCEITLDYSGSTFGGQNFVESTLIVSDATGVEDKKHSVTARSIKDDSVLKAIREQEEYLINYQKHYYPEITERNIGASLLQEGFKQKEK